MNLCPAPWMHLLTDAEGNVTPCCVWEGEVLGNIATDTIQNIAHSPAVNNIRKAMMSGEAVGGCKGCDRIERSGVQRFSQRDRYKSMLGHLMPDDIGSITFEDGSLKNPFKMELINEQYSNLCNYSCRTCFSLKSSMIAKENNDKIIIKNSTALRPEYFKDMLKRSEQASAINIIGGEGMLISEYWQMLDHLIACGRHDDPSLAIFMCTNGSKLEHQGRSLIEYAKKFRNFTLSISIDAIGERAELFRNGTNWSLVERNIRTLIAAGIQPIFCMTVSATNIWHLPDVHKYLIQNELTSPHILPTFSILVVLSQLSCQVLPLAFKLEVARKLDDHVKFIGELTDGNIYAIEAWRGVKKFMLAEDDSHLMPKFVAYHKDLDDKRGQDTFKVFPELRRFDTNHLEGKSC